MKACRRNRLRKSWGNANETAAKMKILRWQTAHEREESGEKWLPNMDSNHDKLLQRQLCYRYTIRQAGTWKVKKF
jgi:hypothetical protein